MMNDIDEQFWLASALSDDKSGHLRVLYGGNVWWQNAW